MEVYFDEAHEKALCTITLTVLNLGDVPFRLQSISGFITLSFDDGTCRTVEYKLAPPTHLVEEGDCNPILENGHSYRYNLQQALPQKFLENIPDVSDGSHTLL